MPSIQTYRTKVIHTSNRNELRLASLVKLGRLSAKILQDSCTSLLYDYA